MSTMQSVSSSTTRPPEPMIAPTAPGPRNRPGVSASAAGMQPPDGPPICTALKLPSVGHAAADVVDDLADGDAHGHFDQPAAADLAGQGEDLGALALFGAQRGERRGAVADDPRHQGVGFDVVDQRGLAPQAALGRERAGAAEACRGGPRSRPSAPSPRRRRTPPPLP